MTKEQEQRGVNTIRQVRAFELAPYIMRLIAGGVPVTIDEVAEASGWKESDVQDALGKQPSTEWDDEGRIVGFGLTLRPTPHRFVFEGKTMFGWCASDTLMFPVILDVAGIAESTCAATGRPIRVQLDPDGVRSVEPAGAVVSEVRPQEGVHDVRSEVCGLGHFFSSREVAAPWLAVHPEGQVNTVHEDFVIHAAVMDELGWRRIHQT